MPKNEFETYTKNNIDSKLGNKQDQLTAGDGIVINNNTIESTPESAGLVINSDGLLCVKVIQ